MIDRNQQNIPYRDANTENYKGNNTIKKTNQVKL